MSTIFPVTHSVLSTTALENTIRTEYALNNIDSVIFYQAGLNDTYLVTVQVTDGAEKYILRVYRKDWRSLSDIQCEIDLLLHLQQQAIDVAAPITKIDGTHITSVEAPEGTRYIVLFNYAPGKHLTFADDNILQAEIYANSMAKMHKTLESFSSPHQRYKLDLKHLLDQPLQTIEAFLTHRPDDWQYLIQLSQQIKTQFKTCPNDALTHGYCHGDLNGDNAHLHNKQLTLFDFDCCGQGHQAYDLAVFYWGARLHKKEKQLWEPFIASYNKERELTSSDLEIIPLYIGIRHIWHIGLHTLLSIDRGRHWIDDAYFDKQIEFLKDWEKDRDEY